MDNAIYFDGNGYVNNRGVKSRYWGVTTNLGDGKTDRWIVSVHPIDMDCTQSFFAQGFELDELAAARVAAYLYEIGTIKRVIDPTVNIPSVCGKFIYRIRPQERRIVRMRRRKSADVYEFTGKRPLNVLDLAGEPTTRPPEAIRRRGRLENKNEPSVRETAPVVLDAPTVVYKSPSEMTPKEVNDTSFNTMCKILDGMKMEPHQARTLIAILKTKI